MGTIRETNLPNLFRRGKVRDTYDLGGGLLLMISTDRISAFDVVLPNSIPDKGVVLCQLSAFWFQKTGHIIPNHFILLANDSKGVAGAGISGQLPPLPPELTRRAMVVKRAQRIDIECVVRGYLAGSAWSEYSKQGTISGLPMPTGMREGERFSEPFFTPTTKAEVGHDQNISFSAMEKQVGPRVAQELKEKTIAVYDYAHEYALKKGIIIADTKLEFGILDGKVILIDELLTPDSSRFWDASLYQPGHSQPNFDKQFVRDWLTNIGWDREPPAPALPEEVVAKTRERYTEAFYRLTGRQVI
ncbi:MAG: phosphoribosylaminoimidazolesuccinocarboxamide synthase [Chloroflexi bacterium]|nr:phosphoribosylaminoimidazolesuccinocarboxamide synthase [Chloroflexota bacterium]